MSFLKSLLNELDTTSVDTKLKKRITLLENKLEEMKGELNDINSVLEAFKVIATQAVESAKLIDENRQMIVQLYNVQEIIASATIIRPSSTENDLLALGDLKDKDDKNKLN